LLLALLCSLLHVIGMTDINDLLARIDKHIEKSGAARSTVSRKLFGNGNRLDEIQNGGSLTMHKFVQAKAALLEMEQAA
jgi:hypothetical protein